MQPNVVWSSMLAVTLFATAAASQSFAMTASTGSGSAGSLCNPVTCGPPTLLASRGEQVQFMLQMPPTSAVLFFASFGPPICTTLPGIANPLLLPAPEYVGFSDSMARIYHAPCVAWVCLWRTDLPLTLPSGVQIQVQALALASEGPALSGGIEIIAR